MKLANLYLKNPTMNGSGICSWPPSMLKAWEEAGVGAAVTKSMGRESQLGYKNPTVVEPIPGVILNAMGLPGPGYKEFLKEMKEYKFSIPVIYSVHARDEYDFAFLVKKADNLADAFELNVSCPHSPHGKVSGYIIGYEPKILRKVLKKVRSATERPISVKLPYYSADNRKLKEVVQVIEECEMDWITEINTLSAMAFSDGLDTPILANKTGGQSGPSIHCCALAQVYRTRGLTDMPIVGVGGIVNSKDARDFFKAGANAVQLGSGLLYHKSNIGKFVKEVLSGL